MRGMGGYFAELLEAKELIHLGESEATETQRGAYFLKNSVLCLEKQLDRLQENLPHFNKLSVSKLALMYTADSLKPNYAPGLRTRSCRRHYKV